MIMFENLRNNDLIKIKLFGKEKTIRVFSTGDSKFDDTGKYKKDNFLLNEEEISLLNWFVENININDYKGQITKYCNERYYEIDLDEIKEEDLESEIDITAIAINIRNSSSKKYKDTHPEISFYGNCKCEPEHGIFKKGYTEK